MNAINSNSGRMNLNAKKQERRLLDGFRPIRVKVHWFALVIVGALLLGSSSCEHYGHGYYGDGYYGGGYYGSGYYYGGHHGGGHHGGGHHGGGHHGGGHGGGGHGGH